MADAALPGRAGYPGRPRTAGGVSSSRRQLQLGLLRTGAFVAAYCAVPGVASLFS